MTRRHVSGVGSLVDVGRPLLAPVWCWWPTASGTKCPTAAGDRTDHPGYGPCSVHEPSDMRRAWRRAVAMSEELDVSPWEALLLSVRLAAARVRWVDDRLDEAARAADGDPGNETMLTLLKHSRLERQLMARVAKAAIDAGVAERLVQQVELEGKVLADALDVALTAAGVGPDGRLAALEAAHRSLTATVEPGSGAWAVPGVGSGPLDGAQDVPHVSEDPTPESGADGPGADDAQEPSGDVDGDADDA